jgi:hypothetical protein
MPIYENILNELYNNKNCILFKKSYDSKSHKGYQILKSIRERNPNRLDIPKAELKPCIDEILIIYLIYFSKVARDSKMIEMVTKFVILLREHINIIGWDYKKKFVEFGVKVDFNYKGAYTSYNDCHEIPDFVNDFISVFICLDGIDFNFEMKDILDICQNFCNWLFVNNLTNFKIVLNDLDVEEPY